MKTKRILICLVLFQTLLPLMNAQSLQSSTEKMPNKSTQKLWTDTEVQKLVNELNALSENYIQKAFFDGWNCGYKEGLINGKNFYSENPPLRLKAKYFGLGFCGGAFTGAAGLLFKLRL
ncbi:hypothetical protein [Treponema sp. C6A8]|uniref:hypothetical protein n=1 Tax=Treponema sp. C6A8 TaxID=1410609 RepID=UPI000489E962|nr:hypothetical protein [Treponema sp. C6A8]